jgi:ABC-type bacteriocin/lantibiotic exporter with double-glycine peptidase domain
MEQSDCGVACLAAVIRYYNGFEHLERLREWSGTTQQGTTMLGLYQAAKRSGLLAQGKEASVEYLKTIQKPAILHVVINNLQHYVLCYGFRNSVFQIDDPSNGPMKYNEKELESVWKSHTLLELTPEDTFVARESSASRMRQWFFELISADRPLLMLITVSAMIAAIAGISVSIFLQQLVDNILPGRNIKRLVIGLVLMGILLLIRAVTSYFRGYLLNLQGNNFNARIIDQFYSKLLSLPKFFFSNRRTGELVARMEDSSRIQSVIGFLFGDLLRDILLTVVYIGLIFYFSAGCGLVAFAFIPVFLGIARLNHKNIIAGHREVMTANAKKTTHYINTLNAIDTIKVNNKEQGFSNSNRQVFGIFLSKLFRLGKLGVGIQFACEVASVLFILCVAGFSSFQVFSGSLTVGQFAAIISISTSTIPAINSIAFANTRIQGARVAFERMFAFTGMEPEYTAGDVVSPPVLLEGLSLKNVSFAFPGRKLLLKNVSMEIRRAQTTVLVGRSGEGKTTLLNLLVRLYPIAGGMIQVNGKDFGSIAIPEWRGLAGIVPQDIHIFNRSLLENVCLDPAKLEDGARFLLQMGFARFFQELPQQLFTPLGEDGINLSGGQRQLVALARALYKRPQFLLMDEPTSAMDSGTEQFVIELLTKIRAQTAILIITHRLNLAEIGDVVYSLENGVVAKREHQYDRV